MRVAVISDLHGNLHALEAALDAIDRDPPDQIICAGDIVNPFLRSLEVWRLLQRRGIACVRGNHEDYLRAYHEPELRPAVRESVQFMPVQIVAKHVGREVTRELSDLPFSLTLQGPRLASGGTDDIYVCHASPAHNAKSYWLGVDDEMANIIRGIPARTLIAGHMHVQWSREWEGKRLVIAGSVGLPLTERVVAEYTLLEHVGGEWRVQPRTVGYDVTAALREYRESGALREGGPIGWMLYREIATAQPHLAHFLPHMARLTGKPLPEIPLKLWQDEGRAFLTNRGEWEEISPYA
jgi:predicted phosphodiesterase